jgi:hypothetical protein
MVLVLKYFLVWHIRILLWLLLIEQPKESSHLLFHGIIMVLGFLKRSNIIFTIRYNIIVCLCHLVLSNRKNREILVVVEYDLFLFYY